MAICIRPADHGDIPAILAIYNDAVTGSTATADCEPHTFEQREAWLEHHKLTGFPVVVAVDDSIPSEAVGWGALHAYHPRIGYAHTAEDSVYVAAARRGRGIGRLILANLLDCADEIGMHAVVAAIADGNPASERLHASFGFKICGRLPETMRKFDRWIDIVLMVKILD